MKFGSASPADAIGGVTVHTLRQGSLVLKKGTTIGRAEVEAGLAAASRAEDSLDAADADELLLIGSFLRRPSPELEVVPLAALRRAA